ncbi:MAG: hypothetical protein NT080_08440 [Spirochaetes bacterium]|nr:hypothetical protein [Spirochaetota bacterium]
MTDSIEPPAKAPDCLTCVHFRVSWDPDFPRACAFFEIKAKTLPSFEVFAATGKHCPCHERRLSHRRQVPDSADIQVDGSGGKGAGGIDDGGLPDGGILV